MSFLLRCPNCEERNVHEFRFGGEVNDRPLPSAPQDEWTRYFYDRRNVAGMQQEWWYHRTGCRKWFMAYRDTVSNEVTQTFWPQDLDR